MKTLKWSLLVVLVTGAAILMAMLLNHSPRLRAPKGTERNQRAAYQSPPLAEAPVRRLASAVSVTSNKTDLPAGDIGVESASVVRVRADQVLAKVNDHAILLADLVPLQPHEQAQAMTSEEYESRLNRAIEMELTFQAAAAQGVDLTPAQRKRVDGIAQRRGATVQEFKDQGVTWSSVSPAQVEFEKRLTSALMLQQNLVAAVAPIAPAADAGVQVVYEQARSEVLSRLKSQSNISIQPIEILFGTDNLNLANFP